MTISFLCIVSLACTYAFQSNGECMASANYCNSKPMGLQQNSACHCCKNEVYGVGEGQAWFQCGLCLFGTFVNALGHQIRTCEVNTCQSSTNYCNKGSSALTNSNCHCCQDQYLDTLRHVQEQHPSPCQPCLARTYQVAHNHSLSYCSSTLPSEACSGLSQYESCLRCPAGDFRANYTSYYQCRRCASRGLLWKSDNSLQCLPWCKKGEYLEFDQLYVADCLLCPAGKYQDQENHRLSTCNMCPLNSYSSAGSRALDNCKCNAGFDPEFTFDRTGKKTDFNCYCAPCFYVNGTECVKCQICDPRTQPGHYNYGCGKTNAGECKKCAGCDNPSQQRAGCGLFSAGECKDKDELVRTPFCPVKQTDTSELAKSVRQVSGLGPFSFEQVFGTDTAGVYFICSAPCDGVMYDSIQCDGPFACNVKTCAEKTAAGDLPRAYPVVIEERDQKAVRERKRRETCVACNECRHANEYFGAGVDAQAKYSYYEHWGGGCVRECSKLMCSDNTVWDWTARGCK
jgi:hypothetical protein